MKQKIIILLGFFILNTFSSFAVIDVKKDNSIKTIQHFKNDKFSKKESTKKRKFRLRDLFVIKKKLKRVKEKNDKKESKKANWSLGLSILGIVLLLSLGESTVFGLLAFLSAILGFIMGVLALIEINKNPDTLKGKKMAWIGIILGVLWFGVALLLLLSYFNS